MRNTPGLLMALSLAIAPGATAARIYYTDQPSGNTGSVRSVWLDGSSPATVATFPLSSNLRGIAWHRTTNRIFVMDNGAKVIRSMAPNGLSQLTVTSVSPTLLGSDVEIDNAGSRVFWTETNTSTSGPGLIRSANLDGTNPTTVVTTGNGTETPYFFSFERLFGRIYWGVLQSNSSQDGWTAFRRSSFDGVIDGSFMIITPTRSRDIVVNPFTDTAYWADRQMGTIYRRSLSGTTNETVISGMNAPHGLALDVKAQKIYWADTGQRGSGPTDTSARRIARCNLDGSEYENLTSITGSNEPWDLTLAFRSLSYSEWRARFFRTTSPARELTDDADSDGLINLMEYAFNSNPRDPSSLSGPIPQGRGIRYTRPFLTSTTYRIEVSTDLATWNYNGDASGETWTVETLRFQIDEETERIDIEPGAVLANAPRIYYRIRISTNEAAAAEGAPLTEPARPRKVRARR